MIHALLASMSLLTTPESARVEPPATPEVDAAREADTTLHHAPAMVRFGAEGTKWWTFGAGVAQDTSDATDVNVHAAYSTFFVDDVEWALEGGIWNIALNGDDALALNATMIFRWHFYNKDKWSAYVDGGIGLLFSTDDIPNDGTSLNFSPRFGAGLTRELTDAGTRLQVGLRWAHISNARITGNDNNPSRDSLMLYAGVMIPF